MLWLFVLRHMLGPSGGAPVTILITDDESVTRAEIEQAITAHVATLARMPAHWVDRRASIHERIDALLYQWEATNA